LVEKRQAEQAFSNTTGLRDEERGKMMRCAYESTLMLLPNTADFSF